MLGAARSGEGQNLPRDAAGRSLTRLPEIAQ